MTTIHENGIAHPLVSIVERKKTDMIDVMETGMVIEDEVTIADTEIMEEVPHVEVPTDVEEVANLTTMALLDTKEGEETFPPSREVAKEVGEKVNSTHIKEELLIMVMTQFVTPNVLPRTKMAYSRM